MSAFVSFLVVFDSLPRLAHANSSFPKWLAYISSMTPTTADHSRNFEDLPLPGGVDRPPGGTARGGGTKTPRKVQWAIDSRQVDADSSAHALDEHGLDASRGFCIIAQIN